MVLRKTAFCLVMVFLLVSCGRQEWDDTVITNNSDLPVTFRFNHTGEITLSPESSTSFETRVHQHLVWFRYYGQENDPVLVRFVYIATNYGASGEFRLICLCTEDDCDICGCGNVTEAGCDNFCDCDPGDDETPDLEDD